MDRFSLSKKLAIVGVLMVGVSFPAFGNDANQKAIKDCIAENGTVTPVQNRDGSTTFNCVPTGKTEANKECKTAISKIKEGQSEFLNICAEAGLGKNVSECSTVLTECGEEADEEMPLGFDIEAIAASVLGGSPTSTKKTPANKCSNLPLSDYKSDLRDLETKRKDAEREIKDLSKEQIDIEKDHSKDKSELERDLIAANKEKAKKEFEDKEEERNLESQKQRTEKELQKSMRDNQRKILSIQTAKATKVATRGAEVQSNELEVLGCQRQAEEFATKGATSGASNLTNQAKVAKVSGSLGGAGSAMGNKKKLLMAAFKTCVDRVIRDRNLKAEKFRLEMSQLDDELDAVNIEMQEDQKALQILAQQSAQAALDRAKKKQQETVMDQQELQSKLAQLSQMDQQMTASRNRIAMALGQAKASVTEASNDLDNHRKDKPKLAPNGKPIRGEMSTARKKYTGTTCAVCEGADVNVKRECFNLGNEPDKATGRSTGTGTTR